MDRVVEFEKYDINWWVAVRVTRNAGGALELHESKVLQAVWPEGDALSRPDAPCQWCTESQVATLLRSIGEFEWHRVLLRVAETYLVEDPS